MRWLAAYYRETKLKTPFSLQKRTRKTLILDGEHLSLQARCCTLRYDLDYSVLRITYYITAALKTFKRMHVSLSTNEYHRCAQTFCKFYSIPNCTSYKSDFSMTPKDCWDIIGMTTTGAEGLGPLAWPAATDKVRLTRSRSVPTAELWMSKSSTSKQHMINDCNHSGSEDTEKKQQKAKEAYEISESR